MSQPQHGTVTVLMPARNTSQYIGASLESALAQTYTDLEIIVVNDGSSDGTGDIAEEYASRDPRVRVIHGRFGSAAAGRNRAIASSRGQWFALLDSDDLWTPAFLERQFAALARYPGAMLVSGNAVNLGGRQDGRPLDAEQRLRTLEFADLIRDETSVCIATVFNREVVSAVGAFDTALNRSEDYDLWLRATFAGFLIVKNPEIVAYYRRRPDSLSVDEEAMLDAVLRVYGKVARWALSPADRAMLQRQSARFERRRLMVRARRALEARDFSGAAELFSLAAHGHGGWKPSLAAFATRHWPESVLRLMRLGEARASTPNL